MTEFKFYCAQCGQPIKCDTNYSGTQINCPHCQQVIVVPQTPVATLNPPPTVPMKPGTWPNDKTSAPKNSNLKKNMAITIVGLAVVAGLVAVWLYFRKSHGHPPGLIALWSAEGNANDSVGHRHGQLQNQAGYALGKIGRAFAFHGVGDQVTAPARQLPAGTSDRTIDCWIYVDSFNNDAEECIAGYGKGGPGQIFSLSVCHGHRLAFTQWGDALDGSVLEANRWYNIAVTSAGGSSVKLYVDGVNVATGTLNFSTPEDSQFWIGKVQSPYAPVQFYGLIDEVAVYNRALSDDEIKSIAEDTAPAH